MASELVSQLRNWLTLLEHSGVEEIMLPGGAAAFVEAARSLGGRAAPVGAEASSERTCKSAPGAEAGWKSAGPAGPDPLEASDGLDVSGKPAGAARPPQGRTGLAGLESRVADCRLCDLASGRTNAVFGEGSPTAKLMFIGEGPGAEEDAQGRPFVGRAGALLTRIIEAMGLKREEVYIGNVVKCRPPGNRVPDPDEIASCLPYLEKQIEAIGPEIICTLGNVATQTVTGERRGISQVRGKTYTYRSARVVPTFHPAACLRNPDCKKLVWEDIKIVMKYLNLPIRGVTRNGAGTNRN
jgi:DNA polymerase